MNTAKTPTSTAASPNQVMRILQVVVGEADERLAALRQAARQIRIEAGVDDVGRDLARRQPRRGGEQRRVAREPFVAGKSSPGVNHERLPTAREEADDRRLALDLARAPRRRDPSFSRGTKPRLT